MNARSVYANGARAVKKRLKKALDNLDRTSRQRSAAAVFDATTEFYKIIFEAGGHKIVWEIVSRLNGRISRLRVMTLSTANRMISGPSQIRENFDAINRNEPDEAAAACRRHVPAAAKIAESLLGHADSLGGEAAQHG
jgi:GntR family transcriptional regulator, trigonelline degradation regulator